MEETANRGYENNTAQPGFTRIWREHPVLIAAKKGTQELGGLFCQELFSKLFR